MNGKYQEYLYAFMLTCSRSRAHEITFLNTQGRGELDCTFQHLMTMFELSSKQHYTTISRRVVYQVKSLIGVNFFCRRQPNLVTQNDLQMQILKYASSSSFMIKIAYREGEISLALASGSQTCFQDQKGIHIGTIMSFFFCTCVNTQSGKSHVQIEWLSSVTLIKMRLWISPIEVLNHGRSLQKWSLAYRMMSLNFAHPMFNIAKNHCKFKKKKNN